MGSTDGRRKSPNYMTELPTRILAALYVSYGQQRDKWLAQCLVTWERQTGPSKLVSSNRPRERDSMVLHQPHLEAVRTRSDAPTCRLNDGHSLFRCEEFKKMSPEKRLDWRRKEQQTWPRFCRAQSREYMYSQSTRSSYIRLVAWVKQAHSQPTIIFRHQNQSTTRSQKGQCAAML